MTRAGLENDASVLTVGYGGDSVARLLERVQTAGVTHVADVRSKPYSKARPEFSGPELASAFQELGIGYVFLGGQLGGRPDDPECYTPEGRVDYRKVQTRGWFHDGLVRVRTGALRGYRVCLLCSEGRPETCHRARLVAETLVGRFDLAVVHLDVDGTAVSHAEVMGRLNTGQQVLGFADEVERYSRGRYLPDGARRG